MPDLSKRIFGSSIDAKIQLKLKARQQVAEFGVGVDTIKHNNQTYSVRDVLGKDNLKVTEPGSRTPWVRMWCAVEIFQSKKKTVAGSRNVEPDMNNAYTRELYKRAENYNPKEFRTRTQIEIIPHGRKVYVLGDNNFNQFKRNDIHDSIENNDTPMTPSKFQATMNNASDEAFPPPLKNNQYLKPAAGIKSMESSTEGPFGAIKRTTVSFIVHNFDDFQNIYSRYFLKAGASIVVDFGWNTATPYDPEEALGDEKSGNDLKKFLYGGMDKQGYWDENYQGDGETIIGKVVKFDSSVDEQGSFECKLEIVSENASLLGQEISNENKLKERMVENLGTFIINRVSGFIGQSFLKSSWTSDIGDLEESTNYAYSFAYDNLSARYDYRGFNNEGEQIQYDTTQISEVSTQLGVYWQTDIRMATMSGLSRTFENRYSSEYLGLQEENTVVRDNFFKDTKVKLPLGDDNNLFVSFGFLEDELLNDKLSLGENSGRFDSGESFISWNTDLYERQRISELYSRKKSGFAFLYPNFWDKSYTTIQHKDKVPDRGTITPDSGGTINGVTKDDKSHGRMPLRELFINVGVIKDAFSSADSTNEALSEILKTINAESFGVFDLTAVSTTKDNSVITIVDQNYTNSEKDPKKDRLEESNLFTFHPFTKGSIVKSMNLTFQTPQNSLQSMIAIQNTSTGIPLFPLTKTESQQNIMRVLEKYIGETEDFGIRHLPANEKNQVDFQYVGDSSYNAESGTSRDGGLLEGNAPTNIQNQYKHLNSVITRTARNEDTDTLYKGLYDDYWVGNDEDGSNSVVDQDDDVQIDTKDEIIEGNIYAKDLEEYYLFKTKGKYTNKMVSEIIPIDLTMSTFGISGIIPGNVFTTNYLPTRYQKRVYFQTKKVSQQIDTGGWVTSIESVMRVRPLEELLSDRERDAILKNIDTKLHMSANWVRSVGVDKTIRKYFDQWRFKGSYEDGAVLEFTAKCKESSEDDGVYGYYLFPDAFYNEAWLKSLFTGKFILDKNGKNINSEAHLGPWDFASNTTYGSLRGSAKKVEPYFLEYVEFTKGETYTIFVALRGAMPVSFNSGNKAGSRKRVLQGMRGLARVYAINQSLQPWENRDFSEDD